MGWGTGWVNTGHNQSRSQRTQGEAPYGFTTGNRNLVCCIRPCTAPPAAAAHGTIGAAGDGGNGGHCRDAVSAASGGGRREGTGTWHVPYNQLLGLTHDEATTRCAHRAVLFSVEMK